MTQAEQLAHRTSDAPVPLHVRNAPTSLMKNLGYGKGYEWKAGFKDERGFLPKNIK